MGGDPQDPPFFFNRNVYVLETYLTVGLVGNPQHPPCLGKAGGRSSRPFLVSKGAVDFFPKQIYTFNGQYGGRPSSTPPCLQQAGERLPKPSYPNQIIFEKQLWQFIINLFEP